MVLTRSGIWLLVPWFALLVVLLEEKLFFCIASRRGSREVNILQVELAALLVLEAPALLLMPRVDGRTVSRPPVLS